MESCCYSSISTSCSSSSRILNFQGVSLSADRRFCKIAPVPRSHSCFLAKPFLQLSNNFQPLIYRKSSSNLSLRSYKGTISAEAEKQGWDFGRFIKTLYFYTGPPSLAKEKYLPGLDLSKQPPAVGMNKELGYILTFKLKGEDLIRESGIPYTIVRPCALTEEPAGADLIFDQGDNITGKISREEVALICVAALESANACDKTFEVKSVIPFSEPFTVDPENPPPEKDYDTYFSTLKGGITGKEALEKNPVPV